MGAGEAQVGLREDADVTVTGRVSIGELDSHLPQLIQRGQGLGAEVAGTVGAGAARLRLRVTTGDLTVAGQTVPGEGDRARDVQRLGHGRNHRRDLLRQFGGLQAVARAGVDDLTKVNGVELTADARLGASVDVYGDYVIAGAPGADQRAGDAFVFQRTGDCSSGDWKLVAKDMLPFAGRKPNSAFGAAVAIGNDFALVGAPFDGRGIVHVFQRTNSWAKHSTLEANTLADSARFGASLDLFGDVALVGAPGENGGRGAVYQFEYNPTTNTWSQVARFDASIAGGPADGDAFGHSVALGAGAFLFGAPGDDGAGTDAGAAAPGAPDLDAVRVAIRRRRR